MTDVVAGLKSILGLQQRGKGRLPAAKDRPAIPAARASGFNEASLGSAAGIASPLTERAPTDDEATADGVLETWDSAGILVFEAPAKTYWSDAAGAPVVLIHASYATPPA